MKMKSLSILMSLTLLTQSIGVCFANVNGSEAGERFFIKVTRTTAGLMNDDSRVDFEICEIANPTKCEPIGARDYSIRELREMREKLIQNAGSSEASGPAEVFGSILGAITGGVTGLFSGVFISSIFITGTVGTTALAIIGASGFGAGIVVGTLGGILIYRWVRHHKEKKAAAMRKKAEFLADSVIEGKATTVNLDISEFAKDLGEVLSTVPQSDSASAQSDSSTDPQLP